MGCACSSCLRFPLAVLCCSRSLTIFTAKWYSGCCVTGKVFLSICLIVTLPKCILSLCILSPIPFSHLSVPTLRFGRRVSVQDHLLSAIVTFFPTMCATVVVDFSPPLFARSTIPFLVHLRKWSRINRWSMAISSSCLFDNLKLHKGSNDMRPFLTRHLGILFL